MTESPATIHRRTSHQQSLHTRLRAGVGAVGLISLLILVPIGAGALSPASAHSELKSTSPASGSTLTKAPTNVQLTFGEDIQTVGDGIVVTAPNATRVDTGKAVIKGTKATQSLKALTTAGVYTVRYRIVSADGHVVASTFAFTYKPVAATTTPSPATTPVAASTTADTQGSGFPTAIAVFGTLAVLAAAGMVLVRRSGRKPTSGADG